MLAGISYLVSQNLIHGAINSSNVLLSTEGIIKIGIDRALTCNKFLS